MTAKHPEMRAPKDSQRYISVTQGLSGYFAVMMWLNPEMGGFWEPWDTGVGRYEMQREAEMEARQWAISEGLEFRL